MRNAFCSFCDADSVARRATARRNRFIHAGKIRYIITIKIKNNTKVLQTAESLFTFDFQRTQPRFRVRLEAHGPLASLHFERKEHLVVHTLTHWETAADSRMTWPLWLRPSSMTSLIFRQVHGTNIPHKQFENVAHSTTLGVLLATYKKNVLRIVEAILLTPMRSLALRPSFQEKKQTINTQLAFSIPNYCRPPREGSFTPRPSPTPAPTALRKGKLPQRTRHRFRVTLEEALRPLALLHFFFRHEWSREEQV